MSKDTLADRYVTKRWTFGDQTIRYVRTVTGNDDNPGSALLPWRTLEHALASYAIAGVNHQWVIDVGSGDGTVALCAGATGPLNLGGTMLGGINFGLNLAGVGPNNFLAQAGCQLQAAVIPVDGGAGPIGPLTITASLADLTTGRRTITVAELLVAGAHATQLLLGEGLAEWARIVDNTDHDITITTTSDPSIWTTSVQIYTEGAIIRYGDPADFFNQACYLLAAGSDWAFTGIRFESTADAKTSALEVYANAPVNFTACLFDGIALWNGPGVLTFDACCVDSHFYGHNGAEAQWRNCLFVDTTQVIHGSSPSGTNRYFECTGLRPVTAFGYGNANSRFSAGYEKFNVDGGVGDGIRCSFGNNAISQSDINDCAGAGIIAEKHAWLSLTSTTSRVGVNGTYGLDVHLGAQVETELNTDISGVTSDLRIGHAGNFLWADFGGGGLVDIVDLGELCRVERNNGA